jgi:hypothetical protein
MFGLLPPSSRLTFFTFPAARRRISWPVAVSPVKATLPTPGWAAIEAPAVPPGPVTTLTMPGGKPASRASSPRRMAVSGVYDAGLRMQAFPVARAGPSFHEAMFIGKFHGTMRPTTPIGSRSVKSRPGRLTGIVSPKSLFAAPA